MRVRGIVLFLMFLATLQGDSWGIDNNPVGRGTAPASDSIGGDVGSGRVPGGTYRGGLVRSPNPIDGSGNLIVTGNVRGGKYFRGIVPYQSSYSFEAGVPSSSLDSFLRDSVGSEDIGGAGKYVTQPYYSGTRTVTTMRTGDVGVFRPASARIDDRASSKSVLPRLSEQETPVRADTATPYTSTKPRPLSMSPVELEEVILQEVKALSGSKKSADEQHRPQIEPLLQDSRMASDKVEELKRSLLVEDKLLQLPTRTEAGEEERKELKAGASEKVVGEGVSQTTQGNRHPATTPELSRSQEDAFWVPDVQVDVYEQMKRQINEVKKFLAQPAGVEQAKEEVKTTDGAKRREEGLFAAAEAQRKTGHVAKEEEGKQKLTGSKELPLQLLPEGEAAEKSRILEELSEKEPMDKEVNSETTLGNKHTVTTPELSGLESAPSSRAERRTDVAAKAKEILGEHKTFASFAEDKFNRHMRAAEEYLKRGRYYRAADAYTLASIYKPDDPLAYAGKSHALFAAGEYMSSALFLTRALEIFPEYAQFKIDLVAMVGDKDKLESRIANIEKWLDESDAAELQFLLGYIYYQMGRQAEAGEMINAAFEKMPESPAVAALKKAIAASE
jgi:tetratricopeptide (TPR) repeat protein